MPQYLVKVEDDDGWLSPPIVVAAQNETRAEAVLRLLIADNCTVTMMGPAAGRDGGRVWASAGGLRHLQR
jgi:hypothetical protein